MFAKLLEVLLQLRIVAVGAADDHQRRPGVANLNLLTPAALLFPGLAVFRAVQHLHHRRIDHAKHRFALLNQGDIDRELAVALDKLFGAVQRIHQPVALPVLALLPLLGVFFRQDRDIGGQRQQAAHNDFMRSNIRRGNRRIILLAGDVHRLISIIDFHNGIAGDPCKLTYLF